MHASSLENMQKAYDRYVNTEHFAKKIKIKVMDIGGANVNGSYADIFSSNEFEYKAVDIHPGDAVDIVLDDPYTLPFADAEIDILISGQAFEHVECFWDLFKEMSRVIKRDGLIILIAPSGGPIHRYPVDCYRFYPDAYSALASYVEINLVDVWMDTRGPWNDLVGIFSKSETFKKVSKPNEPQREKAFTLNLYEKSTQPTFINKASTISGAEKIQGSVFYIETLKKLHATLQPQTYIEIGVRLGKSLALSEANSIGIDPVPAENIEIKENHKLFKITSDEFFEFYSTHKIDKGSVDFAFIDGMHLFEFVLRDFINIEKFANSHTVVVIDDIFPNHPIQAQRNRVSRVWTGDVWKIKTCLEKYRPDLNIVALDTSPTGLLVITGLKPNNKVLEQRYNPIIREFSQLELLETTHPAIERTGALDPNNHLFWEAMSSIKSLAIHKQLLQRAQQKPTSVVDISIVVVSYNMARELPRTLYTLQESYQVGIKNKQIEIIVVDNGSTQEINIPDNMPNVRLIKVDAPTQSPVKAINIGIKAATGRMLGVMIDGARMASPGILQYVLQAEKLSKKPIIATLGFHLGVEVQMASVDKGYNQQVEDELLDTISWRENGYELFNICALAGSSANGYLKPIAESNALFMTKAMWLELDGYDEKFVTPGGGLCNHDAYSRALALLHTDFFILLGEGTFHQVHGGVATNKKGGDGIHQAYASEYMQIRGVKYTRPERQPQYLGSFNAASLRFCEGSK
jgi:ubiquinone/menaquinone biosynthesis C-methylase UbiE